MENLKKEKQIRQNTKDYLQNTSQNHNKETIKAIYNHLNVNGFIVQLQKS